MKIDTNWKKGKIDMILDHKRVYVLWTNKDLKFLMAKWSTWYAFEIAAKLGKSPAAVRSQAVVMKLTRPPGWRSVIKKAKKKRDQAHARRFNKALKQSG